MGNRISLSLEEKGYLIESMDHPGYKIILKILDKVADERLERVAQYNLEGGSDRELAFLKARHEGSVATIRTFKELAKKIRLTA